LGPGQDLGGLCPPDPNVEPPLDKTVGELLPGLVLANDDSGIVNSFLAERTNCFPLGDEDEAITVQAQNRPLWRLMSAFGATHPQWCLPHKKKMMK